MQSPLPILDVGFIRVGAAVTIPALLLEHGISAEQFIGRFGLNPTTFTNADNVVAYADLARLVSACAKASGCEAFGLQVGCRANVDLLGYLGEEMRKARTLGEALKTARRILVSYDRGAILELSISHDEAEIRYVIISSAVESAEQVLDAIIGVCCNVIQEFCGPQWRPSAVGLSRRSPKDLAPFATAFPCRIHFNRPYGFVRFPKIWLDQPLASFPSQKRRRLADLEDDSSELVIAACIKRMIANAEVTADAVATELTMTRRTLHRRLVKSGTTFQLLLNKARSGFACRLLRDTDQTATEIAFELGYSELAAFTRAFQSWSGQTPSEYRQSARNCSDV